MIQTMRQLQCRQWQPYCAGKIWSLVWKERKPCILCKTGLHYISIEGSMEWKNLSFILYKITLYLLKVTVNGERNLLTQYRLTVLHEEAIKLKSYSLKDFACLSFPMKTIFSHYFIQHRNYNFYVSVKSTVSAAKLGFISYVAAAFFLIFFRKIFWISYLINWPANNFH